MKKTLTALLLLLSFAATAQSLKIVPKPVEYYDDMGEFLLSKKTAVYVADNALQTTASLFSKDMAKALNGEMKIVLKPKKSNSVALYINGKLKPEQYKLTVSYGGTVVTGGSARAVAYGLQTLRQIIIQSPKEKNGYMLKGCTINDMPFFAYRGGLLDVGRYFLQVDEVKKFIDILALHKINRFHFHLTEDQGWRIEIKKYPKLTEVGAFRSGTQIGHTREVDNVRHGGFYTQDQIREIVEYARQRYIDVIPEIEMPGHSIAALASYPELGCTGGPYEVRTRWGISKEVYCAGSEQTFKFIEDVLTEVLSLFPSQYIHLGGDECPKDSWKACPKCQQRIKELGLKDEYELQSYFMKRIEKWLNDRGRKIIGWDEILEGGVSPTAVVMSWRGKKGGIEAAKKGNKVIMCPHDYCYLNYYQTSDPDANSEPESQGKKTRYINMEKCYSLDPFEGLTADEQKCIWGIQANLWGEYVPNMKIGQFKYLPRIAAMSEVGWSTKKRNYNDFVERMNTLRKVYDYFGLVYAPYFFEGRN